MINKTDLRIGNSVMLGFEILTVKAIEHNPVNDKYYIKVEEDYRQILCDFLNPIPITEEALVKMGAVKIEDKRYNLESMIINIMHGKFIEYVHQIELKGIHHLQNLYYYTRLTELTYEP